MKKGLFYLITTVVFLVLLDHSSFTCFYVILCAMLVGFFVDVIFDREWIKPVLWTCLYFFSLFVIYISAGKIHICETGVGTDVYSPLYTRVLISDVKEIDRNKLSIAQQTWRGIPVDVLKIGDECYDLNGHIIAEGWYPVHDVTPADPNL